MKTLRQFFATSVLTLILALATSAGEMTTGIAPPQPTPTPVEAQGEMTTGLNGDMHTGEATAEGALAGAVVGLVQGVLSLL